MKFYTLSLFPDLFRSWLSEGLVGQAFSKKLFSLENIHPRDFATGVHQSVDDKVYGGGDGMAQSYLPWSKAIESLKEKEPSARVVFLTPQGRLWNQDLVRQWSGEARPLAFVCGRYAGFDERLLLAHADEEISIGDYVLNGGELPAQVIMESLIRSLPGVLGEESSFLKDSFSEEGLLECPSFTRPQEIAGWKVPDFLLSGHHAQIEAYKKAVSLVRTLKRRPDLVEKLKIRREDLEKAFKILEGLSEAERELLGVALES